VFESGDDSILRKSGLVNQFIMGGGRRVRKGGGQGTGHLSSNKIITESIFTRDFALSLSLARRARQEMVRVQDVKRYTTPCLQILNRHRFWTLPA